MIADYYARPLQGTLFKKMRDILMGIIIFSDEDRIELCDNVSKKSTVDHNGTSKYAVENERRKTVTHTDVVRTIVGNRDREITDHAIRSR